MLTVSDKIKVTVQKIFQLNSTGVLPSITAYYSVQAHRSSVGDVQKRKMRQAILSHRCTHVVIQSSQCACVSFAFARCDWNCTGNLEKNTNTWK